MRRLGVNATLPRRRLRSLRPPDLGRVDPEHVIGVHVNAATVGFIPYGEIPEEELATFSPVEKARAQRSGNFLAEGNGDFQIQATRPQTLSYGLTDSPVGQLAWIVEKFKEWSNAANRAARGRRTPGCDPRGRSALLVDRDRWLISRHVLLRGYAHQRPAHPLVGDIRAFYRTLG